MIVSIGASVENQSLRPFAAVRGADSVVISARFSLAQGRFRWPRVPFVAPMRQICSARYARSDEVARYARLARSLRSLGTTRLTSFAWTGRTLAGTPRCRLRREPTPGSRSCLRVKFCEIKNHTPGIDAPSPEYT